MCMGLPMQVLSVRPGRASVAGRGEQREVDTALIGPVQPGDWLLVFLDAARERLTPERAAEVDATLDLVAQVMAGAPAPLAPQAAAFALPSAMDAAQLAALTGAPSAVADRGTHTVSVATTAGLESAPCSSPVTKALP